MTSNGGAASATVSAPENQTAVTTVTATDPGGHALTYTLSGGADAALFAIDATTGVLTFKTAQDYENPSDANHDRIYDVTVTVSDGTQSATQALHVALANLVENQTRTLTDGADSFVAPSADNWTIHAGAGNDVVTTGAGNDLLDGGAGIDTLTGGAGDDTYWVDNGSDRVIEAADGGNDTVIASVNYTLRAGQEIETLRAVDPTTSTTALSLTGNEFANLIQGNIGNNILDGGLGNDILTGGGGADRFNFDTALGPNNVDTITDFIVGQDFIQLRRAIFAAAGADGTLKSTAFYIGTAAHAPTDRILYDSATGYLSYDDDGTGPDAPIQFAHLDAHLSLTAASFHIFG